MGAKFEFIFNDETGGADGGVDIKNATFVEAMSFLGTAIFKIVNDIDMFAKKEGMTEEQAAGMVLEITRHTLMKYGKRVGKETMGKAYEIISEFDAEGE